MTLNPSGRVRWFMAVAAFFFPFLTSTAQVTVSLVPLSGAPGEKVMASLSVHPAEGIAGGDIQLRLPECARPGQASMSSATSDFLVASHAQPGKISIAFACAQGMPGGQTMFLQFPIHLDSEATPGTYPLTFDRLSIYNAVPQAIPSQSGTFSITITSPPIDQDQDGLPDEWELRWLGNTYQNGDMDSDHDGASNFQEFIAGTDPGSMGSVFYVRKLDRITQGDQSRFRLEWEGPADRAYEVYWSDGPFGPSMVWHQVYNPDIKPDGTSCYWIDDGTRTYFAPANVPQRFYRVLVAKP